MNNGLFRIRVLVAVLVTLAGTGCTDLWPPSRTATATPAGGATVAPTTVITHTPGPAPTRTVSPTATPRPLPTPTATPAPPSAVVRVHPPTQSAGLNQMVSVSIQVEDVTNLFGLDLAVTFDVARLEALDGDGNAENGVQFIPGDLLDVSQGFAVRDVVDNVTGKARYVFALAAPAAPVSGSGTLVRLVFRTRGAGSGPIKLDSVMLADDQASIIPVIVADGSITVAAE